jgi:hypothetical protein
MFNKSKIVVSVAITLGVLGTASAALAGGNNDDGAHEGGFVIRCSLDGVNPVYHPDIFGNPAVAREYGFVKSRNGGWQVEKICARGPYHN